MPEITLEDVADTQGGHVIVRATPFDEIGILGTGSRSAVYWDIGDTDKVIDALMKLRGMI